eukprot:8627761-Alexandrium_andersonii.AAC.1
MNCNSTRKAVRTFAVRDDHAARRAHGLRARHLRLRRAKAVPRFSSMRGRGAPPCSWGLGPAAPVQEGCKRGYPSNVPSLNAVIVVHICIICQCPAMGCTTSTPGRARSTAALAQG